MDIKLYQAHGYSDREEYLQSLADEFGADLDTVKVLSQLLGTNEDFDGLVNAIQDLDHIQVLS